MTPANRAQIVTFRLGDDLFAADINDVERVLRYAEPTPVPNVPEWVKGVIEYRSRVVPVIDLRERFGLASPEINGATRLMVLSAEGDWVAAVVDAVLEVVALGESQLAAPPTLFRGLSAEFLRGILRRNDRLVIVLDVTRLLTTHERLAFDAAMLGGASLGSISIGSSAADVGADAIMTPSVVEPASSIGDGGDAPEFPFPISGDGAADPHAVLGSEPSDGGPLRLVGTSEDAPRPDEAILGTVPAPPDPPPARDGHGDPAGDAGASADAERGGGDSNGGATDDEPPTGDGESAGSGGG